MSDSTPRPDPVGERNYALGTPVVRPEGEGTPGQMRQAVPAMPLVVTPPVVDEAEAQAMEVRDEPHARPKRSARKT